jgi:hypothetical protein
MTITEGEIVRLIFLGERPVTYVDELSIKLELFDVLTISK